MKRILMITLILISFLNIKTAYAQEVNVNEFNYYMWAKINDLRASEGKNRLVLDDKRVKEYAAIRAEEASEVWSHTRPDGTCGIDALPDDRAVGENLSQVKVSNFSREEQQRAADEIFEALCNSKDHYENMVRDEFIKVGIQTHVEGNKLVTAYIFEGYRNETKTIIVTIN